MLPAMPKLMPAAVLLPKTMVPAFCEAPEALIARFGGLADIVTVEPFIPNETLFEFENTTVPALAEAPAALMPGTVNATEPVMVLLVKPKLTLLLLANETVPEPTVEPPAAIPSCTRV